jgi:hypothetical protein
VVKLKNCQVPPFLWAYGLRQTCYLYIGQLTAKTFLLYWLLLQSIFIPVHFIDILDTLFLTKNETLFKPRPIFFQKLKEKEKNIPSAAFSL